MSAGAGAAAGAPLFAVVMAAGPSGIVFEFPREIGERRLLDIAGSARDENDARRLKRALRAVADSAADHNLRAEIL